VSSLRLFNFYDILIITTKTKYVYYMPLEMPKPIFVPNNQPDQAIVRPESTKLPSPEVIEKIRMFDPNNPKVRMYDEMMSKQTIDTPDGQITLVAPTDEHDNIVLDQPMDGPYDDDATDFETREINPNSPTFKADAPIGGGMELPPYKYSLTK
jgi:hypothetical protein